ncbi:hypothetical protein PMAYCL1PPCAC_10745, partial [Pristionchus mayeri]
FSSFLHPDYGVCYTFESDREITRPGSEQGLRMLMTVHVVLQQDSPRSSDFDFLPTTGSAAIRAAIHLIEDFPDFDTKDRRDRRIDSSDDLVLQGEQI